MGFGGRSQLEIEELIPENQRSERFAGEAPSVTKFLYKLWSAHKSTTQEAMPDQRRAEILGKLWSANMSATLNYDDLFEGYAKMVVRAGFAPEPQSIIFYGSGDANWIAEDQNRILLENERLKTQLISEQRAVLQARQHNRQLTAQNESLVDGVCILAKANKALQAALVARSEGRVCFYEVHTGTVSEKVGDQIEVTYETPDGPLKQVYHRAQFMHGKLPEEGDAVEAYVIIAAGGKSEAQKESEQSSDLPNFRDKGVSGTIRI